MKGGTVVLPNGNPASGIERFPETQRERFLSPTELALLQRAVAYEPEDVRDFIKLLLLTGARKGAVLSANYRDIDFDRAEWRVPAENSKSGMAYTIPLVHAASTILQRRAKTANGKRVFQLSDSGLTRAWGRIREGCRIIALADALGEPMPSGTIRAAVTNLETAAAKKKLDVADFGIPDCTLHDLRRTHGSYAAIVGTSLHIVGKMLGQKSTRATAVYARLSRDAVRAATEKTAAALFPAPATAEVIPIPSKAAR